MSCVALSLDSIATNAACTTMNGVTPLAWARVDSRPDRSRNREADLGTSVRGDLRAGAISRQVQDIGKPGQLPAPVGEFTPDHRRIIVHRAEYVVLPDRVVCDLHGQWCPFRRIALSARRRP